MSRDLVGQVMAVTGAAALALAAGAAAVGGGRAALGVAAGAAISLLSFRWLTGGAARMASRPAGLALGALGLRYATMFTLIALLLGSGGAHVMGVIVGLSVLPPALIALGLRAARVTP
jgi:hypothetical protein